MLEISYEMLKVSIVMLLGSTTVLATDIVANESRNQDQESSQSVGEGSIDIINNKATHFQSYGVHKGDTTVPTSSRYTSSRAYADDRKRDSYRYYGTGSKSGNSFTPTNIHKSTSSLDSHNYFVTTKSNVKDMEAAGSGITTGSDGQSNYLTVYESPPLHNSGGNSGSLLSSMDEQFGDMAAESGHGGGYGSSHGGGGKGCNSALGLLGVLGLAAYLQNVLRNMQNATAGRKRRDVSFDDPFTLESKLETVKLGMAHLDTHLDAYLLPLNTTSEHLKLDDATYKSVLEDVFPLLSAVAHARDSLIPIHCTHSSVCLANKVLVDDLGELGRNIGIRITDAIVKLLAKLTKDERAEQIRMISKAGKMGRNGRNCLKVFPTCQLTDL